MAIDFSTQIDTVENIDREAFTENYMLPEKPLVIRKLWNNYPAVTKWTLEYFKETLGDIQVGIFDDKKANPNQSFKKPHFYMKFGDYLDLIEKEPTEMRIFLFNVFKHMPELKNDFGFPDITSGYIKSLPFMFFGGANSIVRMHQDMDMSNVFLTQLHGRKRVIMFEPKYYKMLYRLPMNVHSGVDILNPDYKKYPALKYVKGMQTILNHGETLFMPSGYWHHITYLEGGFALSVRSLSPHYIKRMDGLLHVALLSNLDDGLGKVMGNKWFDLKHKIAEKRAEKEMERLQMV